MTEKPIEEIKRRTPSLKELLLFLGMISLLVIFIYILGLLSNNASLLYGSMGALFLPPAGKESIIQLLLAGGVEPIIIFSSLFAFDLMACFVVLSSFEIIDYIAGSTPILNKQFNKVKAKVEKVERYELVTLSLIGFMFIPFQGTGAITTSIIAQFLQLPKWKTIMIVLIGSVASSLTLMGIYTEILGFL